LQVNGKPIAGSTFMVNGLAYSGMGYGYNTASGALDATVTINSQPCPLALLPFHMGNWAPPGGANPDYTAPDYQDPLLAYQVPVAAKPASPPSPAVPAVVSTPLPSLHRPELIRYWAQQAGVSNPGQMSSWSTNKDLLRAIMARPNQLDHPDFTGSNPKFKLDWDGYPYQRDPGTGNVLPDPSDPNKPLPSQYAWDIDNDGDGIADSVWVDLGLPVRYTAEGKAYKPLFAILCIDLDGRLNLNAHGIWQQTDPTKYFTSMDPPATSPGVTGLTLAGAGGAVTAAVPRGQGYGPAEISLGPLFNATQYQALMQGQSGTPGRYGTDAGGANKQYPGSTTSAYLSANQWYDYRGNPYLFPNGGNYWNFALATSAVYTSTSDAYRSPPDPMGTGAVALDFGGKPGVLRDGRAGAERHQRRRQRTTRTPWTCRPMRFGARPRLPRARTIPLDRRNSRASCGNSTAIRPRFPRGCITHAWARAIRSRVRR